MRMVEDRRWGSVRFVKLVDQVLRSRYGAEGLILGPTSALGKAVFPNPACEPVSILVTPLSGAVTPASPRQAYLLESRNLRSHLLCRSRPARGAFAGLDEMGSH